ncbi:MAG: hypothetical protein ACREPJ_04700 [Rhodanobacteraceae bacterium]
MSVAILIRDLQDSGITLTARDDKLHVEAPTGTLTPELRAELLAHKPELLAELTRPESPAEPPTSRLVVDYRLRDHPGQWLVMLGAPGDRFDLIRQDLQVRYGGRLVDVRQHVAQPRPRQ